VAVVKEQYQKIILSILTCCLALVIALYLHSVYNTPSPVSIAPNKVGQAAKASIQSSLPNTKQQLSSDSHVVPDKSLPIPRFPLTSLRSSLPIPKKSLIMNYKMK